ncbi:MAG: hypothetical protein WB493_05425 [Anaeromyxobacteraceae bacterium]
MKKTLALLAIGIASCTGGQRPGPEPGLVPLGTFTGEVDTEAGTVVIERDGAQGEVPARSRGGLSQITEGPGTLAIANSGAAWNGTARGALQCGNAPVTGANVRITSGYASGFAGGVYAQIDSVSTAGASACNGLGTAPTGLDASKGLWAFGSIGAGGSATKEWNFLTASATRFTFRGTLWGVLGAVYDDASRLPNGYRYNVAYGGNDPTFGHVMTYIAGDRVHLKFVDLDGTLRATSGSAASAAINGISADAARHRVWYVTTTNGGGNNEFGVVGTDGTVLASATDNLGIGGLTTIAYDPASPGQAWVSGASQAIARIDFDGTAIDPGSMIVNIATTGNPAALSFGSDGRLYVATYNDGIWAVDVHSGTPVPVRYLPTGGTCSGLVNVQSDPRPGKNVVVLGQGNGSVCELTAAGSYTVIGTGYGTLQSVTASTDLGVFAGTYGITGTSGALVAAGATAYPVPLPSTGNSTVAGVATSPAVGATPAYVWAAHSAGLFRILP